MLQSARRGRGTGVDSGYGEDRSTKTEEIGHYHE
jgi:hypothetical protein